MKKTVLTVVLSIITLACLLLCFSGCSSSQESVSPAEDLYCDIFISDYNGESDSNVVFDGKFEDEIWNDKQWYSNTYINNFDGSMPVLYTTSFTTRYGVYIGTKISDSNLVYNGQFAADKNSLLEYLWTVYDVGDERELNIKYDYNWLNRRMIFLDLGGEGYGTGERMKRGIYVDGELNSGKTNSAGIELFVPWSELGIQPTQDYNGEWSYPQNVYICPNYRAVLPGNTRSTLLALIQNPMDHMTDMWVFSKDGYTDVDKEGAVVGDSINGISKSGTWNLENEENREISVTTGVEWSTIYFKDAYATNFVAETTIIPIGRLSNDEKYGGVFSGFYMLNAERIYYSSMLDFRNLVYGINNTKTVSTAKLITLTNANQFWQQETKQSIANSAVATQEGVKFKMIKDGDTIHYFVNNEYLYTENLGFMSGNVFVGFYSLNNKVIYKDYSYTALTTDGVKEVVAEAGIKNVNVTVNTRGGDAVASEAAVYNGRNAGLAITCESGYTIDSVVVNNDDLTEDVMENSEDAVYTFKNVTEDLNISVSFKKIENPVLFTGHVVDNGLRTSGNITLVGISSPAIKYSISAPSSGYKVSVLPGTYYLYCESGTFCGEISSLNLTNNLEKDVSIFEGKNLCYDSADKTVRSVSDSKVTGASYIHLNSDAEMINSANGSFMVSYEVSAYECYWPCVGFSIKDVYGHSVEFYLGDTGLARLLFGQRWGAVAKNIDSRAQAFTVSSTDKNEKKAKITLIYQAKESKFYFYADDKLVYSASIAQLNEHVRNNAGSDSYRAGDYISASGNFTIAIVAWDVEPMPNRASDNSLLTMSNFASSTVQDEIDSYQNQHN